MGDAFVVVLSGKVCEAKLRVCLSFNLESSSSLKSNEVVFELPDLSQVTHKHFGAKTFI